MVCAGFFFWSFVTSMHTVWDSICKFLMANLMVNARLEKTNLTGFKISYSIVTTTM